MGINDVIDAIILELNEIFGEKYTYYPENVGQGMKVPCFFVKWINGSEDLLVGKRYSSKSHFVIHGHVKEDENKNASLNEMATTLYNLEYITLKNGDLIELQNRNIKVEDGIVVCFIDVNVHLIKSKKEDAVNMESINMNEGVKIYD